MNGRAGAWLSLMLTMAAAAACAKALQPGDPLRDLTPEQRERFALGREVFERVFVPESGLGPLFNSDACGECHENPAAGGSGDEIELHAAVLRSGGFCDPLAERGGPVFQLRVTPALKNALGIDAEPVPAEAQRAARSSPDVFGFGLLDAIPEATILALADPDDSNRDGISGRPNRFFDGRLGRFGRKAMVPTLREFNEAAFVLEQGITNPAVPDEGSVGGDPIPPGVDPVPEPELNQQDLGWADDFVRFLAPPVPAKLDDEGKRGENLFTRIGCAACHVPTLVTGEHPVAALSRKEVAAYTDLLLHDMGPELADVCLGAATPSEFRTEPLMGLRLATRFLHDGRAGTIEEAIQFHGGEAEASRALFSGLTAAERAALIKFLQAL